MARETKMQVKFEKPPVHVTATGSLSVLADDIFHSKVGQAVILQMAKIKPFEGKKIKNEHPTDQSHSAKR